MTGKQLFGGNLTKLIYEAYSIIDNLTPMKNDDCGKLCDKACCKGDNAGMLLFPGEDVIFNGAVGFHTEEIEYMETSGIKLLLCGCECERDTRPLACRIFPIAPNVDKDGNIDVQPDMRGQRMCPIWKLGNVDKEFVKTVRRAFRTLAGNEDILSFMRLLSSEQEKLRRIYKK